MLNEKKICSLGPGKKLADWSPKGKPTLYIKAKKTGERDFYLRYRVNGKDRQKKIGRHYKSDPREGINLDAARKIINNYPIEELTKPKNHISSEMPSNSTNDTFGDLLSEYISHLKSKKKRSAEAVEKSIELHIKKTHYDFIRLKARDIESRHIQEILYLMVENGLKRQVNKVRSYIHAAFEYAASFDNDPRYLKRKNKKFNIINNPAKVIPVIKEFENVKDRNLTNMEFKLYWENLSSLSPLMQMCLKAQILLAGQRFTQLTDLKWKDYDEDFNLITLYDTKGRNSKKQPHILPLTESVLSIFRELKAWNYNYKWPFTIKGNSQIPVQEGSAVVTKISEQLTKNYELEPFGLGDIRRTCETMLSKLRVNKEIRAHLLSHGRTIGVQSIHYDKYDYFDEKKETLDMWENHLKMIFSIDKLF